MDKKELYNEVLDLDKFCLGIRKYVALSEVMYLIKQLDEPQKVVIPQYVADWITYCKDMGYTLKYAIYFPKEAENEEVYEWVNESLNNQEAFALAWINGYEVEKEKKYIIKLKNVQKGSESFKFDRVIEKWYFGFNQESSTTRLYHTKKDLVNAGFGWMFSCPGFEIEEVEE